MKPAEYTAELSGELKQLDAKLAELRQSKAKALAELTQGGLACVERSRTQPSTSIPVATRVSFISGVTLPPPLVPCRP